MIVKVYKPTLMSVVDCGDLKGSEALDFARKEYARGGCKFWSPDTAVVYELAEKPKPKQTRMKFNQGGAKDES